MRELNTAGTLERLWLTLEATVSGPLFEVVVLTEEAPTADTPMAPAPGNRVTACLLDSNADIEPGTGGSVANLTF